MERILSEHYVVAELWTDRKGPRSRGMDEENNRLLNERFGGALPLYVLFTPDGREVARIGGRPSVPEFVQFLRQGLSAAAGASNP